jgi:hypothetical protein
VNKSNIAHMNSHEFMTILAPSTLRLIDDQRPGSEEPRNELLSEASFHEGLNRGSLLFAFD